MKKWLHIGMIMILILSMVQLPLASSAAPLSTMDPSTKTEFTRNIPTGDYVADIATFDNGEVAILKDGQSKQPSIEIVNGTGQNQRTISLAAHMGARVNNYSTIKLEALSNDRLLVTWEGTNNGCDNNTNNMYVFMVFNQDGTVSVNPTNVSTSTSPYNCYTHVEELSNGNLAFVWQHQWDEYYTRVFSSAGTSISAPVSIQKTGTRQGNPSQNSTYSHGLTATPTGYVVAYNFYLQENYYAVAYDFNGNQLTTNGFNHYIVPTNNTSTNNMYIELTSLSDGTIGVNYRKNNVTRAAVFNSNLTELITDLPEEQRTNDSYTNYLFLQGNRIILTDEAYTYDADWEVDSYAYYVKELSTSGSIIQDWTLISSSLNDYMYAYAGDFGGVIIQRNPDNVQTNTFTLYNIGPAAPALSSDATLSSLSTSSGTLTPSFAAGTTAYTVAPSAGTTAVTLSGVVNDTKSSVTINGQATTDSFNVQIPMSESGTTATIVITAEDGSTQTYTINFAPVYPIAAQPTVTSTTTLEDTQSTSGLVISTSDTVTNYYRIGTISGGSLYLADGTTQVMGGDFITKAQGTAGLKFTPAANLNSSGANPFTFDVQASRVNTGSELGPAATAIITVTPVNDAPVAQDDTLSNTRENEPSIFIPFVDFLAHDSAGPEDESSQILAVIEIGNVTGGTATLEDTGVRFVPARNYTGAASFTYTVQDSGIPSLTDQATVAFTIVANAAPEVEVVIPNQQIVVEDSATISLTEIFSDAENDALTYTVTSDSEQAISAVVQGTNVIVNTTAMGEAEITVTATDDRGKSVSTSFTVATTNTTPIVAPQSFQVQENGTLSSTVVASDVDGHDLTYAVKLDPLQGAVQLNAATGAFTYTPASWTFGNDQFTVTVSDAYGGERDAVVSLEIQELPSYTVTFESAGEMFVEQQVKEGRMAVEPTSDPTRTGYTFGGWYTTKTFSTEFDFDTVITEDLTVYAKWNLNSYTVAFNEAGGTLVADQTIDHFDTVTEPNAPTRTGYTFLGWFIGEEEYDFSTEVSGPLTLTAKWELNSYTITFDENGGSIVADPSVNHFAKVTEPTAPTRTGYTFLGWFIGEEEYDFTTEVSGPLTLTAKWELNSYTITFDENGGSTVADPSVNHFAKVTEPTDPTREGYTFAGWYNGTSLYDFTTEVSGPITLQALWLSQNTDLIVNEGASISFDEENSLITDAYFDAPLIWLFNQIVPEDENISSITYFRADGEEVFYLKPDEDNMNEYVYYLVFNKLIQDEDYFIVTAEDGITTQSYTVRVAQAAFDDAYSTGYASSLSVDAANGLLANDQLADLAIGLQSSEIEQGYDIEITKQPQKGTVTVASDGSFVYQPSAGSTGVDTFDYRIVYRHAGMPIYTRAIAPETEVGYSNEAQVSITIGLPDAPPSDGEIIVVDEDNPSDILIRLLINRVQTSQGFEDLITMDSERVRQALEGLQQDTSRVIIPTRPGNPLTQVTLPTSSQNLYDAYGKNLSFQLPYVEMFMRNNQTNGLTGDLTLRFNEFQQASQVDPIRTLIQQQLNSGDTFTLVNNPVQINPNLPLSGIRIGLPIPGSFSSSLYDTLRVFIVHSDGSTEWQSVSIENKMAYFTTPKFSTFTLVSVEEAEAEGDLPYIRGFEDNTFRPGLAVTRHQIAAMFARKLSGNHVPVAQATFTDTRGSWAKNEIEYVRANGIMTGVSASLFDPTAPMTRAQIAVTADRYLQKVCGMDMTSSSYCGNMSMGKGYSDVRDNEWGAASIKRMQALGIITGYNDGTFRASEQVTRAQIVTIINRLFEMEPASSYDTPSFTDVSSSYWAYLHIERATRGK